MKKAVIFTLDATLAVIMAMSLISVSLFYISKENIAYEKGNLHRLAMDNLAVMEKSNLLQQAAITQERTDLYKFMRAIPANMCIKLIIRDSSNAHVLTTIKPGCTYSEEYVVSRRVFIADSEIYTATLEAWFK